MPVQLRLTPERVRYIKTITQTYTGVLRMEALDAVADIEALIKRIAELEAAARPACDIEGKYGDKFIRVPHDVHAKLCEVLK